MKETIVLKSGYFVGERFFETRQDAEKHVKKEKLIEYLANGAIDLHLCRDIAEALLQRYTMEERYDYKEEKQEAD